LKGEVTPDSTGLSLVPDFADLTATLTH